MRSLVLYSDNPYENESREIVKGIPAGQLFYMSIMQEWWVGVLGVREIPVLLTAVLSVSLQKMIFLYWT